MLEVVKDEDGSGCGVKGESKDSFGNVDAEEKSLSCVWACPRGLRHWINSLVLLTSMLNFASAHYTPQWAVHIEGGQEVADRIAAKHGFVNLGKVDPAFIGEGRTEIKFESKCTPLTGSMTGENFLKLQEGARGQLQGLKACVEGFGYNPQSGDNNGDDADAAHAPLLLHLLRQFHILGELLLVGLLEVIFEDFYHFEHKAVRKRSLEPHLEYHKNLLEEAEVKWAKQQVVKRRMKRDLMPAKSKQKSSAVKFNDVRWPQMWYLNRGQGLDMNVQPAWQEGISGKGVVVTILDDGLEKSHPDLIKNYDPQASYDVNSHDEDPMPRYDVIDSNRHGTRCAGEVAAVANNTLCSVGVAFGASVGGVRMLDGDVTDAVEARSLSLNPQHIDIYSASWGPDDDGKTVDGPGELATRAFIEGVTKGRQGKGSIFVWASGNGGRDHDNCNCDGYTNSIWTLSISSATENGGVPWYSEACSSTLATTYSSGASTEKQIVTTDLHHQCTNGHTGTSASAPLAAGICALALEANRDLTWRDMQHIVVRTARPANLISSDWKVNGVGRNVSHSFGYGLMDASAMVKLARIWKTVPEQHRCEVSAPHMDKLIPARSKVILNLTVTECPGVNFLEHVQAKISLSSSRRGDLQIYLTSPAGTRSTLLAKRPQDSSKNPFTAWPFMSVHTWGEMPFGIWQLEIHNEGRFLGRANLQEWSLLFYGTAQIPPGAPNQKPPQRGSGGQNSKQNAIQGNGKPSKAPYPSQNYSNRKNMKNWKTKSSARIGKISNSSRNGNGTKAAASPTTSNSPKSPKVGQRLWFMNKTKAYKGTSKMSPPTSTPSLPLTIVLGPSSNLSNPQKVPDIFQKYPKVQQLYPIYLNAGRIYNEENLIPKADLTAPRKHTFQAKAGTGSPISVMPKTERQDRYDTSSVFRTSTEGKRKLSSNKKTTSRNQQPQGHFEDWQMLFYGTEDSPNGGTALDKSVAISKGKGDVLMEKVTVEDDIPNHLGPEAPNRSWKDQATRRDDMMRTTTDPLLSGPSSGCSSMSKTTSQCIECITGMFLVQGRCEAKCPVKWYQTVNSERKPICLPCHYTCLTCAGPEDGQCTSCFDEAVPVRSGSAAITETPTTNFTSEADDMKKFDSYVKVEDLPVDSHFSYGKRRTERLVTKKILAPYDKPRPLYYCYPAALLKEAESSKWYFRMSILFGLNAALLLSFLVYFCVRFRRRGNPSSLDHVSCRYVKMKNGESGSLNRNVVESALYLSSSTDEE